jgi:hypothetical protein
MFERRKATGSISAIFELHFGDVQATRSFAGKHL